MKKCRLTDHSNFSDCIGDMGQNYLNELCEGNMTLGIEKCEPYKCHDCLLQNTTALKFFIRNMTISNICKSLIDKDELT